MMSGIRSKDTKPELQVRKALHRKGYRYRLHDPKLPGKPDIVLPKYGAVILVNGCFWHGHACHLFKWPSTRKDFWRSKITRNAEKDRETSDALTAAGWRVLVVWECALRGRHRLEFDSLVNQIVDWLCSECDRDEIGGSD
jgi:DNA mismatch endonuclease (patch repair protein)